MIDWASLKRRICKAAGTLSLMVAGAWLLASYLDFTSPGSEEYFSGLRDGLGLAFFALVMIESWLRPNEDRRSFHPDLAPRWSGVSVILVTGMAAAYFVTTGSFEGSGYLAAAVIVLGTVVAAAVMWRFATLHAADIGEARFSTETDRSPG